ncbi:MAG: TrkA C-terminal domain-containing protein, partial [Eubacterium sp.]
IINGDAGDYALLNEEGIDRMDAVVTLTDSDETNFLVSMYSESLNVAKNVTKINNLNLTKMLEKMGMDTYINVSEITCDMITQYVRAKKSVSSSSMKTLYKLVDGKIEASEFVADSDVAFLGKPLSSLNIKKDVLIAAIHRKNKFIIPGGNDAIEQGDRVIIVSKASKIYELNDILS